MCSYLISPIPFDTDRLSTNIRCLNSKICLCACLSYAEHWERLLASWSHCLMMTDYDRSWRGFWKRIAGWAYRLKRRSHRRSHLWNAFERFGIKWRNKMTTGIQYHGVNWYFCAPHIKDLLGYINKIKLCGSVQPGKSQSLIKNTQLTWSKKKCICHPQKYIEWCSLLSTVSSWHLLERTPCSDQVLCKIRNIA